jgi:bifunctional NMN adenylyltransferase/nudix hydrolase
MKATGVILARFQTPYLHEGHVYLLQQIQAKHNKVVVVLGVSPVKGSRRNPFDYNTREKMLKQYSENLIILPLPDHASDKAWSLQLDTLLQDTFPEESFVLYGSRDCFIPYYSGRLATEELPELGHHSATALRDAYADKTLVSEDFRIGINYAYHSVYPKVYPTVDIAVVKDNATWVLMGQKPGMDQWRFPGGFTDPEDDSYEVAALRELKEECGDLETGKITYIGSAKIDDWRYRSEADKIITSFYKAEYVSGNIQAKDDLVHIDWIRVDSLQQMIQDGRIVREHIPLIQLFLQSL